MRINIFTQFMLNISPLIFVNSQNLDFRTQCMDADDRTIHDINPTVSWSLEGACKRKYCKEVRDENNYNAKFAIVVESGCQPIPSPPYDPPYDIKNCKEYEKICEAAPIEKASKKEFPDCCPRHICICGSKIWQWTTNDKGQLSIKKQQSITKLISTGTDQGSASENFTSGDEPESSTSEGASEISSSGDASESPISEDTPESPISGDTPESPASGYTPESPTSGDAPESPTSGDTAENPTSGDAPESPTSGDAPESPTSGDTSGDT
ncbi:testis-specific gene A8 protein-like isoform X2 [Chrysoperla carnea]|uniref:testis-specific gene A8 protein-like isoform X2 n=1 Tax=Chrysoperla carnea TaxID=189513 RepID=UPI001D05E7EB|nr:testis-specific gene A8 protein-like isoform X2 [Chrysoperla carnea]